MNVIKHIESGKAVARATGAHFLIESALTIVRLEDIMSAVTVEERVQIQTFYSDLVNYGFDSNVSEFPHLTAEIERKLVDVMRSLAQKSRTAKLWIEYVNYISTLKMLLRAERRPTADWKLHLFSIMRMINLFAATGHNNYAKCARLYV